MSLIAFVLLWVATLVLAYLAGKRSSGQLTHGEKLSAFVVLLAGIASAASPHFWPAASGSNSSPYTIVIKGSEHDGFETLPAPKLADLQGTWDGQSAMGDSHGNSDEYDSIRMKIDSQGIISGTAHFIGGASGPYLRRRLQDVTLSGTVSQPASTAGTYSMPSKQSVFLDVQFSNGGYIKQRVQVLEDFLPATIRRGDYIGDVGVKREPKNE